MTAPRTYSLSDRKLRLLAEIVHQRGLAAARVRPVADRSTDLELSFSQRAMWVQEQMFPAQAYYNDLFALRLRGPLDIDALRLALARVVERHEILRAHYPLVADLPGAWIAPQVPVALPVYETIDVRGQETALLQQPFDLERGPVWRAQILRLSAHDHIFQFAIHHLAFDGWSFGVLRQDLAAAYGSVLRGANPDWEPLRCTFFDFAAHENQQVARGAMAEHLRYWVGELAGAQQPARLRSAGTRTDSGSFAAGSAHLPLLPRHTDAVRELARREGTTPFVIFLSVFESLAALNSDARRIAVGTPVSLRTLPGSERAIGCFLNTVVLTSDVSDNPRFRDILIRVGRARSDALQHAAVPFQLVVEALGSAPNPGRNPLLALWFTLDSSAAGAAPGFSGLEVEVVPVDPIRARADLALLLTESSTGVHGYFEYDAQLFSPSAAERMAREYVALLERSLDDPSIPLADLRSALEPSEENRSLRSVKRRAQPVALPRA